MDYKAIRLATKNPPYMNSNGLCCCVSKNWCRRHINLDSISEIVVIDIFSFFLIGSIDKTKTTTY